MSIVLRRTLLGFGALAVSAVAWFAFGSGFGSGAAPGVAAGGPDCAATAPAGAAAICARPTLADAAARSSPGHAAAGVPARMLVEVASRSCAACRRMEPVVKEASRRCAAEAFRVEQRWVEEEEGAAYARRHAVFGVPTFLLLDGEGREVKRFVGEQPLAVLEGALRDLSGGRCGT
ncbi:MAG TPA: thioredoxin family protein [Anaeromyxobacteraceae bacterium]|nr:thioredoxin family protein [Anaeromyxobacteraceae bacterium]